jgi:hypothetical protein
MELIVDIVRVVGVKIAKKPMHLLIKNIEIVFNT